MLVKLLFGFDARKERGRVGQVHMNIKVTRGGNSAPATQGCLPLAPCCIVVMIVDCWDDGLHKHLQAVLDTHDMLEMSAASKIFEKMRKPLIDRARVTLVMFRLTPPGQPIELYKTVNHALHYYLYKKAVQGSCLTEAEKQLNYNITVTNHNITVTLKLTCRMWADKLTFGCSSWIWSQSMLKFLDVLQY